MRTVGEVDIVSGAKARRRPVSGIALALLLAGAAVFTAPAAQASPGAAAAEAPRDPRSGDAAYERSRKLFGAIKDVLDEAAKERLEGQMEPSPLTEMMWRQLGLDRQARVRDLLGSAFEQMTDAPVVSMRESIARSRGEIAAMREQIAELKEQRISAPKDGGWGAYLGLDDDHESLTDAIEDLEDRIEGQQRSIEETKQSFAQAMEDAGAPLPPDQVDLLLDSVTGGDLVELAAAYEAVRGVSEHLRGLMDDSGEDLEFARRYYGMHTALIALLVEAQTNFLQQIDGEYLPKLEAIEGDIVAAARDTNALLREDPTAQQREALLSNKASQRVAMDALELYRDYLKRQREQIAQARRRTVKELRVADNTLRTVDASFQLRQVMESAAASFEALRDLESPGFERLFRNEQLRKEFQELTEKLAPTS